MTKLKKVLIVLPVIAVIVLSTVLSVSASAPDNVYQNPYCPTLYGNYPTTNGSTARSCGGYATNYRFLQNNRSSYYLTCQYRSFADGYYSIFNDGYIIAPMGFHDEYSPYYGTDSIIYGASSVRGRGGAIGDHYLYMPTYYANDVGINFYFSQGTSSNQSSISNVIEDYQLTTFTGTISISLAYLDSNLELKSAQRDLRIAEDNPIYGDNAFFSLVNLFDRSEFFEWRDDYRIYSVGVSVNFDTPNIPFTNTYCNVLFAIPDAAEYIQNNEYINGVRSMGYQLGFEEGAHIDDFGVFGFIGSSVGGFLAIEIFNGFAIGHIFLVAIVVPLFIWILKIFGGG